MSRLVRLYPRAWRDRYGEEFLSLIEERPPSLADRIDIVRGAVDARLHPQLLVGGPEPAPFTHRLPGLLALAGGLSLSAAVLGIAFGPGDEWGVAESFLGGAMILMLISLPGDYLAAHGRRIGLSLAWFAACIAGVNVLGWGVPALILGVAAWLTVFCGLLAMAAIRAGIGPRGRWLLLAATVIAPFVAVGAASLLRDLAGVQLIDVGSSTIALAVLPYGLAWLVTGARMAVRGSRTITDPAIDPIPTSEVQAA